MLTSSSMIVKLAEKLAGGRNALIDGILQDYIDGVDRQQLVDRLRDVRLHAHTKDNRTTRAWYVTSILEALMCPNGIVAALCWFSLCRAEEARYALQEKGRATFDALQIAALTGRVAGYEEGIRIILSTQEGS